MEWGGLGGWLVLEPPPPSWPGGPRVFEASLEAGRDGARGKRLWAGQLEAPSGHVSPMLSRMGWFARLASHSWFNKKLVARQPRGPVLAPRPGSPGTENNSHCWALGHTSSRCGTDTSPALQMFVGAFPVLWGLFIPRPSHLDSWEAHSSLAMLDTEARRANTARIQTLRCQSPSSGSDSEQQTMGLGVLSCSTPYSGTGKPLARPLSERHLLAGLGEVAPRQS